ncbi:MAG TPA: glycosyltransferase family 4 protein, partial [Acidimicrobiales bacterium]
MAAPGRGARVAIIKPDYRVAGGFERVIDRIEGVLAADGHDVTRITVDMGGTVGHTVRGLDVPPDVYGAMPEYFRYVAGVEAFDALDTRFYDLVISTQPPSVTHRHPRHLSVFYHHARVFYDLEDAYLRAGFTPDPEQHVEASRLVREIDAPRYDAVSWFVAGSGVVRERLRQFNGRTDASIMLAGMAVGDEAAVDATDPGLAGRGAVLSIGRHEFTKRTELVVAAAHLLEPLHEVAVVGTGGRTAWARDLDHRLSQPGADPAALDDTHLWCNTGQGAAPVPDDHRSNVAFLTGVDDPTLERLYQEAPCVVAPAYQEDYGLTAVEAMHHGRPVVVCHDGGGLAELVEHEVTGLVVDPSPQAIADAVARLLTDSDLAARLGANGRQRAAEITWRRADEVVREAVQRVLDGAPVEDSPTD